MNHKLWKWTGITIANLLAIVVNCRAQEPGLKVDSLQEVVITALRFAENLLAAPANTVLNASIQHTFAKVGVLLLIGASNLSNKYYYSILGGPQIRGFYYTTVRYELKQK